MTDGHYHRKVRVPSMEEWYVRLLRTPIIHRLTTGADATWARIDRSPYPYGPCPPSAGMNASCWTLSLLGILHRWTGLTLETPAPRQCGDATCTEDHA